MKSLKFARFLVVFLVLTLGLAGVVKPDIQLRSLSVTDSTPNVRTRDGRGSKIEEPLTLVASKNRE